MARTRSGVAGGASSASGSPVMHRGDSSVRRVASARRLVRSSSSRGSTPRARSRAAARSGEKLQGRGRGGDGGRWA